VKPSIRQAADEVRYFWADAQVALVFDRLRETDSGAVRAMLTATSTANGHAGHIFWAQVSLTVANDRKTITAKLDRAAPLDGTSWEQDIDRCFQDVYQRHTAVPEPVELTGVEEAELETAYLITPVIPEGQVTLFLADQGSTKSYLMLYLATCIALGSPTVFSEPARSGSVVYFDWEVDEQVANKRLSWIARGLGAQVPRGLHYINMGTRGRIFDRIRDMRYMVDRIHPALVVIDSLTFATGADLNSAEYAAPTMTAVGSLGEGVAKLVSAHPNKSSRNSSTEDISVIGSTLFEYRARAIWHMKREQSKAARFGVSMTPRKQFDGPPQRPLAYTMDFDNVNHAAHFRSAKLSDMPSLERSTLTIAAQIRRVLARAGRLDTNQIAEITGLKADVIKMECNRMADVFPYLAGGGRGKATTWELRAQTESDTE